MLMKRPNVIDMLENFSNVTNDHARWIDDFFHFHGFPTLKGIDKPLFSPPLELIENDSNYLIKLEIPGINSEQIDISVEDDTLIVKGEKKYCTKNEKEDIHVSEMYYGSFRREIVLPSDCDKEKIEATHKDGVLNLTIPKIENKTPSKQKINIKKLPSSE